MVYEIVWKILSSSRAQVLQELVGDIRDITQAFTWDPGGAFTKMITDEGVRRSDFLHSILDGNWYTVELPPPCDIGGVWSYN